MTIFGFLAPTPRSLQTLKFLSMVTFVMRPAIVLRDQSFSSCVVDSSEP